MAAAHASFFYITILLLCNVYILSSYAYYLDGNLMDIVCVKFAVLSLFQWGWKKSILF